MSHDRIEDIWGPTTPYAAGETWPARVDTHLRDGLREDDVDHWVQSACVLCSNGCGIDIGVRDGQMVGVRGREGDRVSRGRLGPKGLFGWQGQLRDRMLRANLPLRLICHLHADRPDLDERSVGVEHAVLAE